AGPGFKRMSAEQFRDAVSTLTGIWPAKQDATLSPASERYAKSKWIWSDKSAATSTAPGTVYFRRIVELNPGVAAAEAIVTCDNEFDLLINGKKVASGDNWQKPVVVDLKPHLVTGKNIVAVVATNTTDTPGPAGLWFNLLVSYEKPQESAKGGIPKSRVIIGSDATWKFSRNAQPDKWTSSPTFDDAKWGKAEVDGEV